MRERRSRKGKSRIMDLKGQRFGRLLVVEQTDRRSSGNVVWKCLCNCGSETFASSNNLRSSNRKKAARSCGCLRRDKVVKAAKKRALNLVGKRYGRLIVTKRLRKRKRGLILWRCECDCGAITEVTTQTLRSGDTKSCGCLYMERITTMGVASGLAEGEASRNVLLTSYKNAAEERGLSWDLSDELFFALTKRNCFYCGKEPLQILQAPHCKGAYVYNGIDRVDPDAGYAKGNCVASCKVCNYAKRKMTLKEFTAWVVRAYEKIKPLLAPRTARCES